MFSSRAVRLVPGLLVAALGVGATSASAQPTFSPPFTYSIGAGASAIGYGDYNGDGIVDVVVARPAQNDVVFMAGRSDGTFASPVASPVGKDPVAVTSCTPPMFPLLPQSSDFNNDLKCDLAVSDAGSNDIAVLTGNGNGTFRPAVFYPVDGSPGAIVAVRNQAGTDRAVVAFV
jgi:hypothetical protein